MNLLWEEVLSNTKKKSWKSPGVPTYKEVWPSQWHDFSHPSLVIYFFATPPIKYCRYVGTTSSKPPGIIIMFGQSKTGNSSQIIFIALFCSRCTALLILLPTSANRAHIHQKNQFPEPNRHKLTFLHPTFKCRASISGDALSGYQMNGMVFPLHDPWSYWRREGYCAKVLHKGGRHAPKRFPLIWWP